MKGWKAGIILSLFGSALFAATPLQALPESQIVEKLKGIPVFALTDRDGLLLTAATTVDNGRPAKGGAFFSQSDARTFLQKLQKENPSLAKQLEVRAVLLSDVYKAQRSNDPTQRVDIVYVPNQTRFDSDSKNQSKHQAVQRCTVVCGQNQQRCLFNHYF
jgi:Tic22-like family